MLADRDQAEDLVKTALQDMSSSRQAQYHLLNKISSGGEERTEEGDLENDAISNSTTFVDEEFPFEWREAGKQQKKLIIGTLTPPNNKKRGIFDRNAEFLQKHSNGVPSFEEA